MIATYTSAKAENIDIGDTGQFAVGSTVIQVQGAAWTGSITIQGRARGAGLNYVTLPYQDMRALQDIAAGTAITADGIYAIRSDGLELRLVHNWTGGQGAVTLGIEQMVG